MQTLSNEKKKKAPEGTFRGKDHNQVPNSSRNSEKEKEREYQIR